MKTNFMTGMVENKSMNVAEREVLRIAVIGNVDSGKSTLIGVLSKAILDDGRGGARASITTLKHEQEVGRTSAIGVQMMAFNGEEQITPSRGSTWVDMVKASTRTVSLIDLCGHAKYLKTTVFGLTGLLPNYALVLVGANMGVSRMTREHLVSYRDPFFLQLCAMPCFGFYYFNECAHTHPTCCPTQGLAVELGIPVVVVVTKVDLAPKAILVETMQKVKGALKMAHKLPYVVRDGVACERAAEALGSSDRAAPIFKLSSVTGVGLQNLITFLRLLPRYCGGSSAAVPCPAPLGLETPLGAHRDGGVSIGATTATAEAEAATSVFDTAVSVATAPTPTSAPPTLRVPIDSVYQVPGVGFVVSGTVLDGEVAAGMQLRMGPDKAGGWIPVLVRATTYVRTHLAAVHALS